MVVTIMWAEFTNLEVLTQGKVVTGSGKYGSNSGQSRNMAGGVPTAHGASTKTTAPEALTLAETLKHSTPWELVTHIG